MNTQIDAKMSDEELCVLAGDGVCGAEEMLISRHIRTVRMCARPFFLAGGDGEDLIQEGMLGLLNAVRSYRADKKTAFKTYAEVCIRRRILSAVRTDAAEKNLPLNKAISYHPLSFFGSEETALSEQSVPDPEEVLIGREQAKERALQLGNDLSDLESAVLELYLQGLSQREIAARLGKSVKSVDNAVQRVRQKAVRIL